MSDCNQNCPQSIGIESFYSRKDCLGNDFTAGFRNYMRIYGRFEYVGLIQETQERGESQFIYDRKVREAWRLVITRPMQRESYFFTRFTKSVLLGKNITLYLPDRIESGFLFQDNINKTPDTVVNSNWYLTSLQLTREVCRLNDNC